MPILDDLKTRLELADETYDELLAVMFAEISASAWEYMGLNFSLVTNKTEYFDGGTHRLHLAHANVSNLSLYVDDVLQTSDAYALYPDRGIVKKVSGIWENEWTSGARLIRAVYNGGHEEDDLPQGLRGKLLKQVAYEFRRRRDPGLASVTYPDGSVNKWDLEEWLPDVETELRRHRRLVV